MAATETTKKRTQYKVGGLLDFPEAILDRKNYGYRWISQSKLAEASDGYEPRGWELFKDKDGKLVKRGDLILGQMPIDKYDAMLQAEDDARKNQLRLVLESLAAEEEKLSDEFRKKGGKVNFKFEQTEE